MKAKLTIFAVATALAAISTAPTRSSAQQQTGNTVPVTVENFIRAESDLYMSAVALKEDGFGKFEHKRVLSPIDNQTVIRQNRDTLYSAAVFDLDAGPVTFTLPNPGKRFMSLQVINEDMYSPPAIYAPVKRTYSRPVRPWRHVRVESVLPPTSDIDWRGRHGRKVPIVLQKSPRRGCRIEIRNDRIEANGFLNQRCTSAHDLESILRARMRKIVLQHNLPIADISASSSLSARQPATG